MFLIYKFIKRKNNQCFCLNKTPLKELVKNIVFYDIQVKN